MLCSIKRHFSTRLLRSIAGYQYIWLDTVNEISRLETFWNQKNIELSFKIQEGVLVGEEEDAYEFLEHSIWMIKMREGWKTTKFLS